MVMSTSKQLKIAQQVAQQQKAIVVELQEFVRDVERCERTINTLRAEVEEVNAKYSSRTTTQEDIAFLEGMLGCAKKKLVLEKQTASLDKRSPELMKRVEELVNHPESSPDEKTQAALLEAVRAVQSSLKRLKEIMG